MDMIKVLFVCHGNICRSPMAEFIMKDMVRKRGLEDRFEIDSVATSREEIGNPVYPPARRKLAASGISCSGHAARQITRADYEYYDLIICMEEYNLINMQRVLRMSSNEMKAAMEQGSGLKGGPAKISLMLDYAPESYCRGRRDVADPWYTGNFDATWDDLMQGIEGLIDELV